MRAEAITINRYKQKDWGAEVARPAGGKRISSIGVGRRPAEPISTISLLWHYYRLSSATVDQTRAEPVTFKPLIITVHIL